MSWKLSRTVLKSSRSGDWAADFNATQDLVKRNKRAGRLFVKMSGSFCFREHTLARRLDRHISWPRHLEHHLPIPTHLTPQNQSLTDQRHWPIRQW